MSTPSPATWRDLPDSARAAYLELLRYGPLSRAQLAERLGLSAASLTRISAPLVERGLVLEGDPLPADFGRPSIPLDSALDGFCLIGVSITRDTIVAIATDARMGVKTSRTRPVTDRAPGPVLAQVADLIEELRTQVEGSADASPTTAAPHSPVVAIGVSIGAQIDEGRIVRTAPFLEWENVRAAEILEEATGLPVLLDHDVTALAEAENWFGAGREAERFIVLTVGAGTGFALAIHGRVIADENTGFGTITSAIMGPDWPDFADPDAMSTAERSHAARALGRLVGTAAAFTMPQSVVISGEGARALAGYEEDLSAGIAEVRHHSASGLDIHLREHDFAFWARGAATAAIQWLLEH